MEGSPSDLLWAGEVFAMRAMTRANGDQPARQFVAALDLRGKARLSAAAAAIETTFLIGRSPAGRAERVVTSTQGLWEMRVTAAGGTPPHIRLLYLRLEQILWVANGFIKKENALSSREAELGDRIVQEWRRRQPKSAHAPVPHDSTVPARKDSRER